MINQPQTDLTPDEIKYLEALRTGNEALMLSIFVKQNGTINEKTAPKAEQPEQPPAPTPGPTEPATRPTAWRARERRRSGQRDSTIRVHCVGLIDEIRDAIDNISYEILDNQPNRDMMGIFEADAIAEQLLSALIDFLMLRPSINQLERYHVGWYFDIEIEANGDLTIPDKED